jgi:hypothetical protein
VRDRLAYLLGLVSIQNVCALYFLTAPVYLDRLNAAIVPGLFGVGYAISGIILLLAAGERLSRFADVAGFHWTSIPYIALVILCFLSIAANTPGNFLSPWWAYHKYFKLIFPVASMFVMVNIWSLRDLPKLYTLMGVLLAVSLSFMLLEVLMDANFSRPGRKMVVFDDANKFAVLLNIFYGMAFPRLVDALRRGKPSGMQIFTCLVIYAALFATQSRSGILTCVVLTVAAVWASRSRRVAWVAIVASVPVVLLFAAALALRYSSSDVTGESDMARFGTYLVGLNIVRDRPILGVGFSNIITAYDRYGSEALLLLKIPMSVHNAMLELFAELGLFGLVAYLSATFVPVVLLVRRIRGARNRYPVVELAALAVPVVFFCYGLFYPGYLADDHFWIYMTIPLIVLRSRVPDDFELNPPVPRLV